MRPALNLVPIAFPCSLGEVFEFFDITVLRLGEAGKVADDLEGVVALFEVDEDEFVAGGANGLDAS